MKKRTLAVSVVVGLFLTTANFAVAGQAIVMPLEELVKQSGLIAVVDVTKVTVIEVPTGAGQVSNVYVAQAEAVDMIKGGQVNQKMAIVGSTRPRTSAVWQPIEAGRYLAFLNLEQGHYRYAMLYAFRKVDADNNVTWIDVNKGVFNISKLNLADATKRIKEIVAQR